MKHFLLKKFEENKDYLTTYEGDKTIHNLISEKAIKEIFGTTPIEGYKYVIEHDSAGWSIKQSITLKNEEITNRELGNLGALEITEARTEVFIPTGRKR